MDKGARDTELEVISEPHWCYGDIPRDPVTRKPVELVLETTNGRFVIPVHKRTSDRQKCKLVRQRRPISTKPVTLGDKLAIETISWSLAPTNFNFITMFGEAGPFDGGRGGQDDFGDSSDDQRHTGNNIDYNANSDDEMEIDDRLPDPPTRRSVSRRSM